MTQLLYTKIIKNFHFLAANLLIKKKPHTFIGSCKAKLTFYFIIYVVSFFSFV